MGRPRRFGYRKMVKPARGQVQVRGQQPPKKGDFSDTERRLLRDLLHGAAPGRDYMHLVSESVFGMTKQDMERAFAALCKMPLPVGNDREMQVIASLGEKLDGRLKKLAEDEARQQQGRNQ